MLGVDVLGVDGRRSSRQGGTIARDIDGNDCLRLFERALDTQTNVATDKTLNFLPRHSTSRICLARKPSAAAPAV